MTASLMRQIFLVLLLPAVAVAQERPTAALSPFTGLSIDTFAADDLSRYLNPQDQGGEPVRFTAGLNFEYQVFGRKSVPTLLPNSAPVANNQRTGSLWITGATRYGVRSADVDCRQDAQLAVCADAGGSSRREAWLYVLRNARTLEASGGLRWEFVELGGATDPAVLYLAARAGVLAVSGSGDDASDQHFLGLGLLLTGGKYAGSHVEAGVGRSDVYAVQPTRRLKVDGLFMLGRARLGLRPYVQVVLDADLAPGADSLQTHAGVTWTP